MRNNHKPPRTLRRSRQIRRSLNVARLSHWRGIAFSEVTIMTDSIRSLKKSLLASAMSVMLAPAMAGCGGRDDSSALLLPLRLALRRGPCRQSARHPLTDALLMEAMMKSIKCCFRLAWIAITMIAASQLNIAEAEVITVTTTIQDAENAANPGDTIFVPPGIYRETVHVNKDDLTIVGSREAIIDASGFANGIQVGADILFSVGPKGIPVCPTVAVKTFKLIGLTIRNATQNGVFLSGVDTYTILRGRFIDNGDYGVFPSCSNNGQIGFNYVTGGVDTCIYIGNDVGANITGNQATGCTVGIQIVNSSDLQLTENVVTGNTTGILAIVDPLNPLTSTNNVLIESNSVLSNNLPNRASEPALARIPVGTGILNVGSDNMRILNNKIEGNNTLGVAITQNPLASQDPRIDPNPDGNEVRQNVVLDNGMQPTQNLPGADLFYDRSGKDNCFSNNTFKTAIPTDIETQFPCQSN